MKSKFITVLSMVLFLLLPSKVLAENNIFGMSVVNHSDLNDVATLVNSNGGDWGYVTIVMPMDKQDLISWQAFFDECRRLHLIPIVRITTHFDGVNWEIPDLEKIDQQINFLNSLNWVIKDRFVIIGNEPNHSKEWGGKLDPEGYGEYLKIFSSRLNNANPDFFPISAGFDQIAPNSKGTMAEEKFITEMLESFPDVFENVEGFSSHSYPNPHFSGSHLDTGKASVRGYEWELNLLKSMAINKDLPVFITETGWINTANNENKILASLTYTYENIWGKDERVMAVTPFVLNYTQEPFYEFSWKKEDGSYYSYFEKIKSLPKIKGTPKQIVKGEVLFSFLNPFGLTGTKTRGYFLASNTGQNIWTSSNIEISSAFDINLDDIPPFKKGLVAYTLQIPNEPGVKDLKLGLYIDGEFVDNVYEGKIVSFNLPTEDGENHKSWLQLFKDFLNL